MLRSLHPSVRLSVHASVRTPSVCLSRSEYPADQWRRQRSKGDRFFSCRPQNTGRQRRSDIVTFLFSAHAIRGARQDGARAVDLPARSFDMARPGVAHPLLPSLSYTLASFFSYFFVIYQINIVALRVRGGWSTLTTWLIPHITVTDIITTKNEISPYTALLVSRSIFILDFYSTFTSAKKVIFCSAFVCLSVCLFVGKFTLKF